jgi:lipid A 3-O-deacylase
MINFSAGEVGIADAQTGPIHFGIELRFAPLTHWRLIPAIGETGSTNGARFIYIDLRHELWLNEHWVLIPSFGPGFFDNGRDLDLGQKLEFRSGLELAYRFYREFRAGLALFHLSNGGLSERNPGTEALALSLCIPLGEV